MLYMKAFFVAATGQNVGKTTICLGLVAGLKKRLKSAGYLKPVGQEYVETETGLHVDKDVVLFKTHFQLGDAYGEMSPVLFPRGFTRDYLDGRVNHADLVDQIKSSYRSISSRNAITVIEGTGHTGVGSIVDLNNAQVAAALQCPVVIVASGGLGSCFDELTLNHTQCEKYGVKIAGVILNRVIEEKREMILEYIPKALKRWNVPLLGCIPFNSFLSMPTMNDFELLFQTELLAGTAFRLRHFQHIRLVATATEIHQALTLSHQLILIPAGREDILLAALTRFWDLKLAHPDEPLEIGIILTGKNPPKESLLEQIQRADIPVLYAPVSSFIAMKMIHSHTAKIRKGDTAKIEEAVKVVESHIDFDTLLQSIRS
jgi:dethiobiotin synthase